MIHYHGTPIGGSNTEAAKFLTCRHALVSFHYQNQLPIVTKFCSSFVLDNGAFTFWKSNKSPNWDKYYDWVNVLKRHPSYDWHLIPDEIDGSECDNWKLIVHYGKKTKSGVPVYHMHESFDHLSRLIKNYSRIAIGSSGQWPTPGEKDWWIRMNEIMSIICDKDGIPRCKIHGLRMLNPSIFTHLPFSSADSCNVGRNNHASKRYGMYLSPSAAVRSEIIASRIEVHNSTSIWRKYKELKQFNLWDP